MKGVYTWRQLQTIDREAPERIEVPSGSRVTLTYESGRPPILAVRIQEVFGLHQTPRIAGGRVGVLMHLLAPNMRRGPDHRRPGELLGQYLCPGPQRPAGPVSQTLVARGSIYRPATAAADAKVAPSRREGAVRRTRSESA